MRIITDNLTQVKISKTGLVIGIARCPNCATIVVSYGHSSIRNGRRQGWQKRWATLLACDHIWFFSANPEDLGHMKFQSPRNAAGRGIWKKGNINA